MTNPTLTQAEIDAMGAVTNLAPVDGLVWHPGSDEPNKPGQSFYDEARTFIPKAIARIRELERLRQEALQEARIWSKLSDELLEQTRWRHIDQEQPEDSHDVIVWDEKGISAYLSVCKRFWIMANGREFPREKYPYWQPLPTKGPE